MRFEDLPVAPGGEGLLGHNVAFRTRRLEMLGLLAREEAPLLRLRLPVPGVRATVVNDPNVAAEVLVEKARSFQKSDMLRFTLFKLAGEGLFTSNGELWRRQRRLMAPLFTPKAVERYARDMVECALRTASGWRDGMELRLLAETTRLTMGVAGKTLFDADTFEDAEAIGRRLTTALDWTGWAAGRPSSIAHIVAHRLLEDLAGRSRGAVSRLFARGAERTVGPVALLDRRGRELSAAVRFLDQHVQKMIEQRHRIPGHDDLLTLLLEARDEDGTVMTDRQVRDEVLTLFVAGHETTATGLAWTIYFACKDPVVYRALEREADAVGDQPSVGDLPALGLCLRAFKEALRLMPPVYVFGRDSVERVTLGEYDLDPRTNVLLAPWVLHHSPRLYPDPDRFDPDRFLPEAEAARHRYAYLPFGAGPRVCLGIHFAYMEAQLVLAALLRRHRFELLEDDAPEPGATLRPRVGVKVRVTRRTTRDSR
jgi:cytochrome P450